MKTKQAEVISENVEDHLWNEGSLGDNTPQKLLDSLIFCFGLNLALCCGKEHRQLRPNMLELIETPDSVSYLLYTESGSKNHSGGLQDHKAMNKSVKIFPNKENLARCIIWLYKKCISLRPSHAMSDVFYLQPLKFPKPNYWYEPRPVGHNPLAQTVKRLCSQISIDGYFTNHLLHRTCATRLYQKDADEQQIMSVTGHRSIDTVRVYKKISCE